MTTKVIKHRRPIPRDIELFEIYYGMNPRSYAKAGQRLSPPISKDRVCQIAKRDGWDEKIEARIAEERRQAEEKYREELKVTNDTHLNIYKLMQSKAVKYLDETEPKAAFQDGGQAAKVADIGIKGQRTLMGLATPDGVAVAGSPAGGITNTQNNLIVNIGELTKNGDREFILRALKRLRDELPAAEPRH